MPDLFQLKKAKCFIPAATKVFKNIIPVIRIDNDSDKK